VEYFVSDGSWQNRKEPFLTIIEKLRTETKSSYNKRQRGALFPNLY